MIVIAAAGTGGHIYPALAVAEALESSGVRSDDIVFVTSSRPVEDRIFDGTKYQRIALSIGGVSGGIVGKVVGLAKIARAAFQLRRKVGSQVSDSPSVLVMFGGYISAVSRVGLLGKIRDVVVVETNSVMGRANRTFRVGAKATFVAFADGSGSSGVPLRSAVVDAISSPPAVKDEVIASVIDKVSSYDRLIVAFGGSLGAETINKSVLSLVEGGSLEGDVKTLVYLVVGQRDFPKFASAREFPLRCGSVTLAIAEYDNELIEKIKVADLVISRAGSNTIAELSALNKAAILIPLPVSPNDHQRKNALWYQKSGRGVLLEDGVVNNSTLRRAITEALQLNNVSAAEFEGLDAASKISSAVLSLIESL